MRTILSVFFLTVPVLAGAIDGGTAVTITNLWDLSGTDLFVGTDTASNSLFITDGGAVYNDNGYIGYSTGADSNSVVVTGSGSLWSNSGELYVGHIGADYNSMEIIGGGRVESTDGYVGYGGNFFGFNFSDNSSVLVSGDGSSWINTQNLTVGNYGSGNVLTISDGAQVRNMRGMIGYSWRSSNNVVQVTGADAVWNNRREIFIGYAGNSNALWITDGGVVNNSLNGTIGHDSFNNMVVVSGVGSAWSPGGLVAGSGGAGNRLIINDGGAVSGIYGFIGLSTAANSNSVAISGSGSVWSNRTFIAVGYRGSGNVLDIMDGGKAYATSSTIGDQSSATANAATISGAGSVWTNSGDLSVGLESSQNTLSILDGGAVYNDNGYIGYATGADDNSALVTGSGSVWQNDDGLYLGGHYEGTNWVDGGTGNSLTVGDGAWIMVGDVDISTLPDGSINFGRGIAVGDADGAEMIVANGSHVTNGPTYIGLGSNDVGSVLITGSNTSWSGAFAVGYKGSGNSLTIADGAHVSSGPNYIGYSSGADNNSVLLTGAGTVWDMSPNFFVANLTIGSRSSSNSLTIADGGRLVTNRGTIGADLPSGIVSENNSVLVTGVGSVWEALGGTNKWTIDALQGGIVIGGSGSSLSVLDGGAVNTRGLGVGHNTNASNNTVTVAGAGSLLDCWGWGRIGYRGVGNELIISDGGRAQFVRRVLIGDYTGSENRILVTGTNSVLSHTGELYVGNRGSNNSLIIEDGGRIETLASSVEDPAGFVGYAANALSNRVVVSGPGSVWTNSGDVYIGYDGSYNTLNITDGGHVLDQNGYIGYATGADDNSALVTGSGSIWQNDEGLYLGGHYEGTNWVDGGTGNSLEVVYDGTLLVGDVDTNNLSDISSSGGVVIGDAGGDAEMVVANGSDVFFYRNGDQYIGLGADESGTVRIMGANSEWIAADGRTSIGYRGSDSLFSVSDGGYAYIKELTIGHLEGADNNRVRVSGAGSQLEFRAFDNAIGVLGSGNSLEIIDGGEVHGSNLSLLGLQDAGNRLLVDGEGSLLHASSVDIGGGKYHVGQGGVGGWLPGNSLVITNGGRVVSRYNEIYGSSAVVSGAGSVWEAPINPHSHDAVTPQSLKLMGDALLTVEDGGLVSIREIDFGYGRTSLDRFSSSANEVVVSGPDSRMELRGDSVITYWWTFGMGGSNNTLRVEDGGQVSVLSGNSVIFGADNKVVVTGSGSVWQNDDVLYLGGFSEVRWADGGGGVRITNWVDSGSGNALEVSDGALVSVAGDMHNRNYSTVHLDPGGLVSIDGDYYQDATAMLRFGVETNAAGAPINALITVGGTAEFEEGAQIEYASNVGELLFDRFYTNKLIEADALIVAGIENPDSLDLELLDASGSLVDVIFWENEQDIYALAGRKYLADSAGFAEGSMMARLSKEIDDMSLLGNDDAMRMIDLLNTLSGSEQNEELVQQYEYTAPSYLHIQSMTEGLGELVKHISRRPAPAPEGAAGPYSVDREARGWIRPYGSWSDRSSQDGFSGYDHNVYGTLVGIDWIQDHVLLGVAGGYAHSKVEQDDGGESEADTGYGVFFASVGTKNWFGDVNVAFGRSDIEDESDTVFGAESDYKANNFALYLGGGREMRSRSGKFFFTPKASLLLSQYQQNSYTEKMSTGVVREVEAFDRSSVVSSLGAAVAMEQEFDNLILRPEARFRWLHEFNDDEEKLDSTLSEGLGGQYFSLMPAADEDILEVGAGLSCGFDTAWSLALDLDWRFGEDYDAYSVSGRAIYEF